MTIPDIRETIPADVMAAAIAMLDTIDEEEVYIGDRSDLTSIMIDGRVDVIAMARAAIAAIRQSKEPVQ